MSSEHTLVSRGKLFLAWYLQQELHKLSEGRNPSCWQTKQNKKKQEKRIKAKQQLLPGKSDPT